MPVPETGRTPTAPDDNPALTDAVVTGMHGGARPRVGARAAAAITTVAVVAGFVVLGGMFTSAGSSRQRPPAAGAATGVAAAAQPQPSGAPAAPPARTSQAQPGQPAQPAQQGQVQQQPQQQQAQPSQLTARSVAEATTPATLPAGSAATFTALTGVGCPQGTDRGLDVTGRDGGWVEGTSGGFYGYGCTGRYLSMPLSGHSTDSGTRQQTWWFTTGALTSGTCHVYVFVPAAEDPGDTSASVHFAVLPDRDGTALLGEFTVDEQAARDAWADAGWYTLRGASIAVRLTDRGAGRASAGAVLVKCQAG